MLEQLPKSPAGARMPRIAFAGVLLWSVGLAILAVLAKHDTAATTMTAVLLACLVVFAGILGVGGVMRSRGSRALSLAESIYDVDRAAAIDAASRALRTGVEGNRWMRAWMLIAGDAERRGDLATTEEALERALRAEDAETVPIDEARRTTAKLRLAFVRAARGDVDAAERLLDDNPLQDVWSDTLRAEHARAHALVLYKRGRFREVVDFAASSVARGERDRALLVALEQSSLLRLAPGTPVRVGGATHEEWIEDLVPELRARG